MPKYVGALPPQCAALNRTNVNVHELGVLAAASEDLNLVHQAVLLDPLTGALLTIEEAQRMVDEMLLAEKKYLDGFK
jgi:alpha-galactosidase